MTMKRYIRSAAETAVEDRLADAISDLKDDFDYIMDGLDKLSRSGGPGVQEALAKVQAINESFQSIISTINDSVNDQI